MQGRLLVAQLAFLDLRQACPVAGARPPVLSQIDEDAQNAGQPRSIAGSPVDGLQGLGRRETQCHVLIVEQALHLGQGIGLAGRQLENLPPTFQRLSAPSQRPLQKPRDCAQQTDAILLGHRQQQQPFQDLQVLGRRPLAVIEARQRAQNLHVVGYVVEHRTDRGNRLVHIM